MSVFSRTNCLSLGFSPPVTGREGAWLFQGCRLPITRKPDFLVSHLNVHLWDQLPMDERVFSFSWIINYLFQKNVTALKVICAHTDSFSFVTSSELKSSKAKVKILSSPSNYKKKLKEIIFKTAIHNPCPDMFAACIIFFCFRGTLIFYRTRRAWHT